VTHNTVPLVVTVFSLRGVERDWGWLRRRFENRVKFGLHLGCVPKQHRDPPLQAMNLDLLFLDETPLFVDKTALLLKLGPESACIVHGPLLCAHGVTRRWTGRSGHDAQIIRRSALRTLFGFAQSDFIKQS
jgi:hypothetical protein